MSFFCLFSGPWIRIVLYEYRSHMYEYRSHVYEHRSILHKYRSLAFEYTLFCWLGVCMWGVYIKQSVCVSIDTFACMHVNLYVCIIRGSFWFLCHLQAHVCVLSLFLFLSLFLYDITAGFVSCFTTGWGCGYGWLTHISKIMARSHSDIHSDMAHSDMAHSHSDMCFERVSRCACRAFLRVPCHTIRLS